MFKPDLKESGRKQKRSPELRHLKVNPLDKLNDNYSLVSM